ncbi:hypothetical protein DENSPDRAFT_933091 [Dentipellis sp. KUC8613]|nr:hypothetical protein DENSPDRAFT_933091 [Dentipellis sp. KUC8613]
MKSEILSDSDSSGDEEDIHQLTVNEHFAKAYEYRKEREELAKLKEKYGSDVDSEIDDEEETDSESDETEDDEGEELTPAMDAAILRTLARIKRKDPEIYEAGKEVFKEEHEKTGKAAPVRQTKEKEKSSKPLTLPAHRLAAVLDSESRSASPEPAEPTYTEEQARLRAETISAFHSNVKEADEEDEDAGEGGLFTLREKTQDEVAREEEEYRRYLEREVGKLDDLIEVEPAPARAETKVKEEEGAGKEKKKKKKKGKEKEKETAGENGVKDSDHEFLLNYILNRGWIDRSSKRVPTFDEITGGTVGQKSKKDEDAAEAEDEDEAGDEELLDEDEFDDVVDRFESSYNFRFEEPDAPVIPSFPRSVPTVRRPAEHTERRKEARERRKERKEEEKRLRREEVKRLKGLKMREMEQQLKKVSKEGGFGMGKALEELDLEGDWDPDAYDRQMAAILKEAEENAAADDDKPMWDEDIDVADIVPPSEDEDAPEASTSTSKKDRKKEKKKEKKKAKTKEFGDLDGVDVDAMDAEMEDGGWDEEEWDGTEEMRKRVLDKYMDELYGLEFNDMVGDLPTRFHYTRVAPSSYSLTPAEILMAEDKDLNEYMGIKQFAAYRKEKDRWDNKRPEKLREFKQKVGARMQKVGADAFAPAENGDKKQKKRKGKKERMKEKAEKEGGVADEDDVDMDESQPKPQKNGDEKKERKEKKKRSREDDERVDAPAEVEENGSEPAKKKRRRQKKAGKPTGEAAE